MRTDRPSRRTLIVSACALGLFAASAHADLTPPIAGAEEKPAKPVPEAASPFEPMVGTWSGPMNCGAETVKGTLKFDIDDPRDQGRVFIIYTLEAPSSGGFMSSLTLTPAGKPGAYLSADGAGRLAPLQCEVHGRVLTARPPKKGAADLTRRIEVRMTFDDRWRSAAVSFRRGTGRSCVGTLRRGGAAH